MHLQDSCSGSCIWQRHIQQAIKAPRPEQSSVQAIWTVGCCQHHYPLPALFKTSAAVIVAQILDKASPSSLDGQDGLHQTIVAL